jgi:hypothetical protein
MAEKHYVDAGDQTIAAEGVEDHSELTTIYPGAVKSEIGPWMQEQDRQAHKSAERQRSIRKLRTSSVLIGFYASLPVVVSVIVGQLFMSTKTVVETYTVVFLVMLGLAAFTGLTFAIYRWIGRTFHAHEMRALPITLTILASLFFIIQPLFRLGDEFIGGLTGYAAGLAGIIVVSIVISVVSVFAWTSSHIPSLVKIVVLLLFFGLSVATAYLI